MTFIKNFFAKGHHPSLFKIVFIRSQMKYCGVKVAGEEQESFTTDSRVQKLEKNCLYGIIIISTYNDCGH